MNLSKYNGLTRCQFTKWEDQKACKYALKSEKRDCCCWMRYDGTCSNLEVADDNRNHKT